MLLRLVLIWGISVMFTACASHPPVKDDSSMEVTGGMDKERIRRAIRTHVAEIGECYSGRLKAKPNLAGTMLLSWDIGQKGQPQEVRVLQSLDPVLDACISGKLKTWKFPFPPRGVVGNVIYPFMFAPD